MKFNLQIKRDRIIKLKTDTEKLIAQFDEMKFNLQIKRDRIIIHPGYLEDDYCKQLQDTFREETDELHFYQKNPFGTPLLSALEGAVLNVLKKPYAQTFVELSEFAGKYQDFISPIISEFELESQFYLSFCLYRKKMMELNYHFCYPTISKDGEFRITKGYDLALAKKNAQQKKEVVYNDCYFNRGERFFVITGPNQGGKTTFARALGQMVYFASLGLAIPCQTAVLPVFDGIYTHFAVEENLDTGAGKLKEELLRLKDMMSNVTRNSFVIINEIFTSATSYDAYIMGKKVINYFMEEDCLGVYVTHIYELTKDDDRIVSLVAALLSDDSNIRTFKIERKSADGRSYANTIVEKHRMTYQEIKERIRR
jgi:DNA mismatch repair ATPase MutS